MTNVLLPSKMTYEISWSNSNITYHYFCCRFTDFRHEKRLCKNENWSIWGFFSNINYSLYTKLWSRFSTSFPGSTLLVPSHSSTITPLSFCSTYRWVNKAIVAQHHMTHCQKMQWWWAFLLWHHTIPQMLVSPEMTHSDFTVQWPIYVSLD